MPTSPALPAPGTQGYDYQLAHWDDDVRPQDQAGMIICVVASTLLLGLRLYAQRKYQRRWHPDDYLLMLGYLFALASGIASIECSALGLGIHQLRVIVEDPSPPHQLIMIFQAGWFISWSWAPSIMFTKLSLLYFYRRIFLVQQKWFKRALIINATFAIGLGISSIFVNMFQCSPYSYLWESFSSVYGIPPAITGSCPAQTVRLATPVMLGTVSDICVLFLPMTALIKLQTDLRRKLGLMLVFSLGLFVIGCGIARFIFYFRVSTTSDDVTWDNMMGVTFTAIETNVAVACTSFLACAPLFSQMRSKLGGSGRSSRRRRVVKTMSAFRRRPTHNQLLDSTTESTGDLRRQSFELGLSERTNLRNDVRVTVPNTPLDDPKKPQGLPVGAIKIQRDIDISSAQWSQ